MYEENMLSLPLDTFFYWKKSKLLILEVPADGQVSSCQ